MRRAGNAVSVIETAYAPGDDRSWLAAVAAAVEPALAQGMGTCAYTYDASSLPIQVRRFADHGTPFSAADVARAVATADDAYVDETWRTTPFAAGSETPGYRELPIVRQFFYPLGVRDFVAINAVDPSGLGVWVGAPLPQELAPTPAMRRTWTRVASHLAIALRLRTRERQPPAAVLAPSGRVEHADGEARRDAARTALRDAVRRLERARGPLRHRDPDAAVGLWQGLVDARWSLLDHFEHDGRRYVVAVENDPVAVGPAAFTPRERHVVAAAALGHSNKLIAYQLGLKDSTVRVLLSRAARKVAVDTRRELVALYRAHLRQPR